MEARQVTNPTLERAARALALTLYKSEAENYPDTFLEKHRGASPSDLVAKFWQDWLPEARAVLMAVREPDEAMVKAWWTGLDDYYPDDGSIARGHTAMIDAILAEGGVMAKQECVFMNLTGVTVDAPYGHGTKLNSNSTLSGGLGFSGISPHGVTYLTAETKQPGATPSAISKDAP